MIARYGIKDWSARIAPLAQRRIPNYAIKNGLRYRYYISANLNQGGKAKAGSLSRVPAVEIEALVTAAVRKRLGLDSTKRADSKTMRKANANDLIRLSQVVSCGSM
jgi:hypothetical protein